METFFGKYRATVTNNIDPENRGRLQLLIPDVLNFIPSTWAEPCVPLAGPTGPPMGVYMVPPVGAGVWVEFEQGNVKYPIWVGCRFEMQSDVPSSAKEGIPGSPNIVIQSLGQHKLVISDLPGPTGGIVIQSLTGASITVNDTGIYIKNGQGAEINLIGKMVDINGGALSIT